MIPTSILFDAETSITEVIFFDTVEFGVLKISLPIVKKT